MKICSNINCGCSNPDDAIYCSKCGTNTSNAKKIEVKTESDDTWRGIVTIIGIGTAIAIAIGIGGIGIPVGLCIVYGIRSLWMDR